MLILRQDNGSIMCSLVKSAQIGGIDEAAPVKLTLREDP
jgi:hypothetical protein